MKPRTIKSGTQWHSILTQVKSLISEAFGADEAILNLTHGKWGVPGNRRPYINAVDGTLIGSYPMIDLEAANSAVHFAAHEFKGWSKVDLQERQCLVSQCIHEISQHREFVKRYWLSRT
jgi:hypothetical protein